MSEPFTIIVLFVAMIAIAAILFGIWLVVAVLKLTGRALLWVFKPISSEPILGPTLCCPRSGCRAINPSSARFCRRCGHELLKRHLSHRQAAMW